MRPVNGRRGVTTSGWMVILSLIVCESVVGCATSYSGFLGDYSELKPDPAFEDSLVYQNPAKPLKQYDKFIFDPVVVLFAPGAKGARIEPAELEGLANYFRNQAVSVLSRTGRYQVVDAPGPGVLAIRAAITSVKKTKVVTTRTYTHRMAGVRPGGASMEAEGFDSESGDRVIAVVDSRLGGRRPAKMGEGWSPLDDARQVMSHWVRRFVRRLDIAHGYKPQ